MSKQAVNISIDTKLTGTGLDQAEKKIEAVDSAADDAVRSIDTMEKEVTDLEQALRKLDPASADFEGVAVKLGKARLELQQAGDKADDFARKSGGATAGSRNMGLAFLELSRAAEDMQYGVGGAINNLPQLVSLAGGPAGLAAALSLVAVAGNQVYKQLSKVEEAAANKKNLEELDALVDSLGNRFKDFDASRKKASEKGVSDAFEAEAAAIQESTAALIANIEQLKQREILAGRIREAEGKRDLAELAGQEKRGEISPEDAAVKRADIEKRLALEELQQLDTLGKLNTEVFAKKLEAAKKELAAAQESQANASEQLEQMARLRSQFEDLKAAADAMKQLQELQAAGGRDAGSAFEPYQDIAERRRRMDELEPAVERVGFDPKFGANPGTLEIVLKRLQDVESSLNELPEGITGLDDAVSAAFRKIREAEEALKNATEAEAGEQTIRETEAETKGIERDNAALQAKAEEGGRKVADLFEQWISTLGDAAKAEEPAKLIEQVREMFEGGVSKGEAAAIPQLAAQISAAINKVTSESRAAFTLMQQAIEALAADISALKIENARLASDVQTLSREKQ